MARRKRSEAVARRLPIPPGRRKMNPAATVATQKIVALLKRRKSRLVKINPTEMKPLNKRMTKRSRLGPTTKQKTPNKRRRRRQIVGRETVFLQEEVDWEVALRLRLAVEAAGVPLERIYWKGLAPLGNCHQMNPSQQHLVAAPVAKYLQHQETLRIAAV